MGLKVGDGIPEFTLNDQNGKPFRSKDFTGKKPMVIFFYPKDYTPGCTREVCAFRDSYEDFTALGAEVVGISSDSERMHDKFARAYKLPFKLLSDPERTVRRLFRVENSFLLLPGRETYVTDKEGKIVMVFNSVNASQHMKKALQGLKNCLG